MVKQRSYVHLGAILLSATLVCACGKIPTMPKLTAAMLGLGTPALVQGDVPYANTANGGTRNTLIPIFNEGIRDATIVSIAYGSAVFSTKGNTECMVGSVIKPGSSCNLSVDFKPVAVQAYSATLTIVYSGAGQTFTAVYGLTGTGI